MKKKKLKKKIKRLERQLEQLRGCHYHLANTSEGHIRALKNRMDDLENDNKYYKEWMDRSGVDYKSWFEGENNGN